MTVSGVDAPLPEDARAAVLWWEPAAVERAGRRCRARGLPLFVLCTGGPAEQAAALQAGADIATPLPLYPELFAAQVEAFYRERPGAPPPAPSRPSERGDREAVARGPLRLDRRARTLHVAGAPVHLTLREFDLLAYLLDHGGDCCSRDELMDGVWGIDFDTGTNTVDVFIYALRRKLRARGLTGLIQTVRGAGYRLALEEG